MRHGRRKYKPSVEEDLNLARGPGRGRARQPEKAARAGERRDRRAIESRRDRSGRGATEARGATGEGRFRGNLEIFKRNV